MPREKLPRRAYRNALNDLYNDAMSLAGRVEEMLHESVESLQNRDTDLAREIIERDRQIDADALAVEEDAEELIARFQPVSSDLRRIISAMRVAVDLERVADLAVNICRITVELGTEPLLKPLIDIPRMAAIAQEMIRDSLTALIEEDVQTAQEVYIRDEEIDDLYYQIFRELLSFMMEDPRTLKRAIPLLFVARHLERVADHATNIAETVTYLLTGERVIEVNEEEG